jgi:hypothetical protein
MDNANGVHHAHAHSTTVQAVPQDLCAPAHPEILWERQQPTLPSRCDGEQRADLDKAHTPGPHQRPGHDELVGTDAGQAVGRLYEAKPSCLADVE